MLKTISTKPVILFGILILAAMLRLYNLGSYPALNADEAALGYNAYSLLQTGKDEHSNAWPLQFQSFNDFKPGLVVYLVLPMVKLFGLNEWSVRILPALIGIVSVYILFLLAKELSKNKYMPYVAAVLLAVSPWHIHFSRGAWEVNVATFFILLGVLMLFKSLQHSKYLLWSVVPFVLSLYTYHAARIVVPLLVGSFIVINARYFIKNLRTSVFAAGLAILLCIPLGLSFFQQGGLARASGVALWADTGPASRVNELRGDYTNISGLVPRIFHNKPVLYSMQFLSNWSEHFWGEFLFLSGDDIQRNKVPETGELYLIELVFLLYGLWVLFKSLDKKWLFVLVWLLVAPIPAALTFQSPHALRAENMIVPLELISAFGLVQLVLALKKIYRGRFMKLGTSAIVVLIVWSVALYVHMYYVHMSTEYPFSSQYGVKELVSYLAPIHKNYEHVVITDRYDQPYILFLFYLKYDPATFQKEHSLTARDQYGFSTVRSFSNFKFESIKYEEARLQYHRSLLIGTDKEIYEEANILRDIYGTNNYRYFRVVAN